MKKFFLSMMLAFAILIPAAQVSAAHVYVPNFRDITSNRIEERIRFTGMDHGKSNGVAYTSWHYVCVDGKTADYVGKFIRKLNSKHNIRQVGHRGGDWFFAYTGGQSKYVTAFNGGFHIHVRVSGNRVDVNLVAGLYPK